MLLLAAACRSAPPLPVLGQLPQFKLVDQQGAPFGSDRIQGKVALVDFIYTRCTDACPILSANMGQVQKRLQAQGLFGTRVQLVSITVDPEHDPPATLAEYAGRYGADQNGWKFLTGDWDDVYGIVVDFKLGARAPRPPTGSAPPTGTEITHSTRVVLLDAKGQVRAFLPGNEMSPDDMVEAVRGVL